MANETNKDNNFRFLKSSAAALRTGFNLGSGRGINRIDESTGKQQSLGAGAIGLGGAVGAGLGATAVSLLSEGTINPLVGAAVGGTIGSLAVPSVGFAVGAVGELGVKGIQAMGNIPYSAIGSALGTASAYAVGAGTYAFGTIGSHAWNFSKRLVNWDEGAELLNKVKFTGPISGFKQGLAMETKHGGLLGKVEQGGNAVAGSIINGKGLLVGTALARGIGDAWREIEKAHMGTNMGVVTNTPQIPSYANNAGATGDLVFALNANRRG